MKLTVARGELWRGIDTVLDAVPGKPPVPLLANMLIVADEEGISLVATDLDLALRTHVPAKVEISGSVTVPARLLADIIREWPEAELALETSENTLNLSGSLGGVVGGRGTYALAGASPDDFPEVPVDLGGTELDVSSVEGMSAELLGEMIQKTAFAVAREDTQPVLNGVLWKIDRNGMVMVATDRHRFAHYGWKGDLEPQLGADVCEVIVPPRALAEVVKLLPLAGEDCTLAVSSNQLMMKLGGTLLSSRLIEGPYVDYAQVIPGNNDKRLQVETDLLLPAVRRVSTLSSTYTRHIRLMLRADTLELSASSPEIGGHASEVIPIVYDGEPIEIGYNAQYLIDMLRHMESKSVVFELANESTGAIIRPAEHGAAEDYFCLLMPVRRMD